MNAPRPCRGATLIETTMALVVVAAALSAASQLVAASARAARSAEARQLAAEEAANVLERLFLRDWDELNDDLAGEHPLSEAAQAQLRDGRLEVHIVDESSEQPDEEPPLQVKRITVAAQWCNAAGDMVAPLRLSAWRCRAGREE